MHRWEEHKEAKIRIEMWLSEMEEALEDSPDSKGEVAEMKILLEKYKNVCLQIKDKEKEMSELVENAEIFAEQSSNKDIETDAKVLEEKWDKLHTSCSIVIFNLECEVKSYVEYHKILKEIEKWLLEISFELMSENALCITSKQQAEVQIEIHSEKLAKISLYQQTIDDVKSKGHAQIDRYVGSVPSVQAKIESQLQNIQDSYDSVQNTALQIQQRLEESLQKYQECEATLSSVKFELDKLSPLIEEEDPINNHSLEEAEYNLEKCRVSSKITFSYLNCLLVFFL